MNYGETCPCCAPFTRLHPLIGRLTEKFVKSENPTKKMTVSVVSGFPGPTTRTKRQVNVRLATGQTAYEVTKPSPNNLKPWNNSIKYGIVGTSAGGIPISWFMNKSIGRFAPLHPLLGKFVEFITTPIIRIVGRALKFYHSKSAFTLKKGAEMQQLLADGKTVYILGIGPSGHNSATALVEVSQEKGICLICNNEEERYTGINDDGSFPQNSLDDIKIFLNDRGKNPKDIFATAASWDYLQGIATSLRTLFEEAPMSFMLASVAASPRMNMWHFINALKAPRQLKAFSNSPLRVPVIGMRHHNNHAYYAYAISPFARSKNKTMIVVMDGFGDDGSISLYEAMGKEVTLLRRVPGIFDSQGVLYAVVSSTQGGWSTLSSEGRYMGASAWGDTNRLTNSYYKRLRQILYFAPEGQVFVNRSMINYHRRGEAKPYNRRLVDVLGDAVAPEDMWNPDCVLNIDDIKHADITQDRVDKAAALQMVFEDALFHIVGYLIEKTQSQQLILSGGTALNCLANMHLMEHFNKEYYLRKLKKENTTLHLWVPPNPSDTGSAMGAAYQLAMNFSANPGPKMQHAFICGAPPSSAEIQSAVENSPDTGSILLGNLEDPATPKQVAQLLAELISENCIIGLYQGSGETGPRALGHRSILANPTNPNIRKIINKNVKYRELIRPLAPMLTLKEAKRFFNLAEGASDNGYNAYNYMVLTVSAKEDAYKHIPAVFHKDGTSRIQIVRKETDELTHSILEATGKKLGVEVLVNTSLNVGTPIVHSPLQAITALHKSKGITALLMVGKDSNAYLVWHNIDEHPKDKGVKLKNLVGRYF